MSHLQLLCWECHEPIEEDEALGVFTKPDDPWSQSTTRICRECFDKREVDD